MTRNDVEAVKVQQCEYVFRNENFERGKGLRCSEPEYKDGKCILHITLPNDKKSHEYEDITVKKAENLKRRQQKVTSTLTERCYLI